MFFDKQIKTLELTQNRISSFIILLHNEMLYTYSVDYLSTASHKGSG